MTHLERQIHAAQRRLLLNRWLRTICICWAISFAVVAVILFIQRSFDLGWPVGGIALSVLGAGTVASIIWALVGREGPEAAAARLDQAAGLRERLSSGQYCEKDDDPFARAVVADAERISASITARRHLPLAVPRPLPWTFSSALAAALMFLIVPGWLKPIEETKAQQTAVRVEQARDDVEKKLEPLKQMVESNPVLEQYREEIEGLDKLAGGKLRRPDDIRHEAVKKLDNLADKMRQRRENPEFDSVREMRKMLRRVEPTEAPTDKLAQALAKGDFEAAAEEVEKLQEQLATLKHDKDKETVQKLSEQLERIAQQIEQAAKDDRLEEELERMGLTPEETQRILESLAKKDMEQLKKELAEKGLNEQEIDKLAKQMQQKQGAGEAAKQLAQKLGQAAAAAAQGQTGDAQSALSQSGAQLSELEQLEQEMNQLDSAMAALDGAKGDMGQGQGENDGSGEGDGDKPGKGGMGPKGQGTGSLASEEKTDVDFKTEKGKVTVGKGGTTGQFLVDAAQVPGEVGSSVAEIVTAAERDASDRIKRDRIPRQYQNAVKAYFSNVQRSAKELKPQPAAEPETAAPESNGDTDADSE